MQPIILKNNSECCVDIKGLSNFETGIAFTDLGDNRTNCNDFNSKSEKNYSFNNLELTIYFTLYVPL